MEINVKYMTEEAYRTLQKNYIEVCENINNHPSDCSWLKDFLGFEPFEEKKYVIEDFEIIDTDDSIEDAINNGVTLYEHLNILPRYVLCNNRFWAWITFEKSYKYAIKTSKNLSPLFIKNMWLYGTSRRDLMLGIISRLYFRTEVSIDEEKEDKYELTRYLLTNTEAYRNIVYRNIGMLKNVTLGLLQVENDLSRKYNISLSKPLSRECMKCASRIGSVMLIDVMTKKEIYNILYEKLENLINSQN